MFVEAKRRILEYLRICFCRCCWFSWQFPLAIKNIRFGSYIMFHVAKGGVLGGNCGLKGGYRMVGGGCALDGVKG